MWQEHSTQYNNQGDPEGEGENETERVEFRVYGRIAIHPRRIFVQVLGRIEGCYGEVIQALKGTTRGWGAEEIGRAPKSACAAAERDATRKPHKGGSPWSRGGPLS